MYQTIFFLVDFFWACFYHSSLNRHVTKYVLSIQVFFFLFNLNFIYTKKFVHPGSFVTYLQVYVYANISKDNNSKVSKVTKPAFLARVWEWRGIGMYCPAVRIKKSPPTPRLTKGYNLVLKLFCTVLFLPFLPFPFLIRHQRTCSLSGSLKALKDI